MVPRVLDQKQPATKVAADLGVSERTVRKWLARWRAGGEPALNDRSSTPARHRRLPSEQVAAIEALRRQRLTSPVIALVAPTTGTSDSSAAQRSRRRHRSQPTEIGSVWMHRGRVRCTSGPAGQVSWGDVSLTHGHRAGRRDSPGCNQILLDLLEDCLQQDFSSQPQAARPLRCGDDRAALRHRPLNGVRARAAAGRARANHLRPAEPAPALRGQCVADVQAAARCRTAAHRRDPDAAGRPLSHALRREAAAGCNSGYRPRYGL
jgi:leucine-zipper of insertion element IS481